MLEPIHIVMAGLVPGVGMGQDVLTDDLVVQGIETGAKWTARLSPREGCSSRSTRFAESVLEMGEVEAAARNLGIEVAKLEIQRTEDIAPAFEALQHFHLHDPVG